MKRDIAIQPPEKNLYSPDKEKSQSKRKKLIKRLARLKSQFKKDVPQINALLDKDNREAAIEKIQQTLLKTVVELIPIAEDQYRQSNGAERAAYALNAMISQAREIVADIQASQDITEVTDRIVDNILQPSYIELAAFAVDQLIVLKRDLSNVLDDKEFRKVQVIIEQITSALGMEFKRNYTVASEKIREALEDI